MLQHYSVVVCGAGVAEEAVARLERVQDTSDAERRQSEEALAQARAHHAALQDRLAAAENLAEQHKQQVPRPHRNHSAFPHTCHHARRCVRVHDLCRRTCMHACCYQATSKQ